jgi:hypothetical protein
MDLDHLHRAGGRMLAPEILDQVVHGHRAVRVEQQPGDQSPLCPAPDWGRAPGELDLERTEEAREHGYRAFEPIATRYSAWISRLPSVASLRRSAIARSSSRHSSQRPSVISRSRAFSVGP